MTYTGRIVEVSVVPFGDVLTADAAAGALSLSLNSVVDFEESGGTLSFVDEATGNTVVAAYSKADPDADTITLVSGLAVAASTDTFVSPHPPSDAKVAQVLLDDQDDALSAVIQHADYALLPEGVRDPEAQEAVEVDIDSGGEWYVSRIFGVVPKMDGAYLDPTTVPPSPPAPPAAPVAPTFTVTGMPRGLMVQVTNGQPGWTYTYTITDHTTETTADIVQSYPDTPRPVLYVEQMPSGTPLSSASDGYSFHITATNASGSATSGESVAQPLVLNDSNTIAELAVGKLLAGDLVGAFALLGALQVGDNISITPEDGIVISTPLGDVRLPADGSKPQFKGEAEFDALTVLGNMKVQGQSNEVAKNSTIELATGTTAPKTAPVPSAYWPSKTVTQVGFNDRGLTRHAATGLYFSTDSLFAGYVNGRTEDADSFDASIHLDLTATRSEIVGAMGGVTIIADAMYVLCLATESGYLNGRWYVYRWNYSAGVWSYGSRWLYEPESFLGTGSAYDPCIGVRQSNGNIVIAQCGNSGSAWLTTYTPAGAYVGRVAIDVTDGSQWSPATDFRACGFTSADFGVERFYIASSNNASIFVHDVSTMARTTDSFTLPDTGPNGFMWDSSKAIFRTFIGGTVYDHTSILATTLNSVHTWRKADATGPDFAAYETDKSPAAPTASFPKRAALLLTTGPIPADGTDPNSPDAVTFYVATDTSGTLASFKRQTVPGAGQTFVRLTSLDPLGGNPPAAPNFPAATPARITSDAADTAPLVDLRGSGQWRLGDISGTSDGRVVGGAFVPIGGLVLFGGAVAPAGFLFCNGGTFSSATYPLLAAVLGDTFGVHSGTTYYLPDMRRRTPWGVSDVAGNELALGQNEGVTAGNRLIGHRHGVPAEPAITGVTRASGSATGALTTAAQFNGHNHGGQTDSYTQPFMGLNYLIRAS